MGDKPQEMELASLSLRKLKMLLDQLRREINLLKTSSQSLEAARIQFTSSIECLRSIRAENVGKEILVPLTSSLYVPGQLEDGEKVLVDIGVNYYVEKSVSDANEFLKRKLYFIKQQMEKLLPAIERKYQTTESISELLQSKINEEAKKEQNE